MMKYKGYLASVEFDDSTDVLHGRVVNSGPYPIATFEATETRALRREFERSVDEYLGWCEEDGVEPWPAMSSMSPTGASRWANLPILELHHVTASRSR